MVRLLSFVWLLLALFVLCYADKKLQKPNIIIFLADDVGITDIGYTSATKTIPTPFINSLSSRNGARRLTQYYVNSLCTPTRASLLTGRYAHNTGLTYVIIPGSPSGLPDNIETLPQILEREGYMSYICGKWHLGHSSLSQTPTKKGFNKFTGIYGWDIDPNSKRNWLYPRIFGGEHYFDWVKQERDRAPYYFAETEHATTAITKESIKMIDDHVTKHQSKPLFLYVAYTSAHSPLLPEREESNCKHIKHYWRRSYCSMVVGIDISMENIMKNVILRLGENSIIVFSSDNGGSSWFGGLNYPLRGSKNTPFEGGIRVPGFILDMRRNVPDRDYDNLLHVSDIAPTILGLCSIGKEKYNKDMDGFDHSISLFNIDSPVRTDALLELRLSNFSTFSANIIAYRSENFKLILGDINEDDNYYMEPFGDRINVKHYGFQLYLLEQIIRIGEYMIGTSEFDSLRIIITHHFKQAITKYLYRSERSNTLLFNIRDDPSEIINLADQYPEVVSTMKKKIYDLILKNKTIIQNPKLQYNLYEWPKTFVQGNCSMNPSIKDNDCVFTAPWLDDKIDTFKDINQFEDFTTFINSKLYSIFINVVIFVVSIIVTMIIVLVSTSWLISHYYKKK